MLVLVPQDLGTMTVQTLYVALSRVSGRREEGGDRAAGRRHRGLLVDGEQKGEIEQQDGAAAG